MVLRRNCRRKPGGSAHFFPPSTAHHEDTKTPRSRRCLDLKDFVFFVSLSCLRDGAVVPKLALASAVRIVAAIPSVGLLAGAAAGFLFPEGVQPLAYALLAAAALASVWAWWTLRPRVVAAAVAVAFAAGGALLAADAWQRAWRPTLRVVFEELARVERARAAVERRVLPEDDEAFAIVEGVLRSDASRTASGVSLSVARRCRVQ